LLGSILADDLAEPLASRINRGEQLPRSFIVTQYDPASAFP